MVFYNQDDELQVVRRCHILDKTKPFEYAPFVWHSESSYKHVPSPLSDVIYFDIAADIDIVYIRCDNHLAYRDEY
jgi:hypothetical protein